MITIIDYAERENALFSNKTFQAVDSLVLSQLAYLYFDEFISGIDEMAEPVALEEIAARENREELCRNTLFGKSTEKPGILFCRPSGH